MCRRPDNPHVFLPLPFLGKAWPDHGLLGPLAIGPMSTVTAFPSGTLWLRCPSFSRPGLDALQPLLEGPRLSSGGCCQAFPVLGVWICSLAFPQWEPPSREKEPCAGQGQCLRLLPDPLAPAYGSEHGACLMQQRMPLLLLLFLIQSSCSELVFKETQIFKKRQPLLSLGLCCSTERIGRRIWDEDPRPFPIGARSQP